MTNEMELFSFKLDFDAIREEEIYYLDWPTTWWEFIESKRSGENYYKLSIQPSRLNRKLETFFPGIFQARVHPELPWLLADEEVDPEILKLICLRWFEDSEKGSLPTEMKEESLKWKRAKVGEIVREGNFDSFLFSSVAGLKARKFARKERELTLHKTKENDPTVVKKLQFRHINYDGDHECMSEPVYHEKSDTYFSYVVRFKVETRGGLPEDAVLNVRVGVRRFVQEAIDLPQGINRRYSGTVLIGIKNPFYRDSKIESMSTWKFRRIGNTLKWKEDVDELFMDIFLENLDLTPEKILANPLNYMKHDSIEILPVYSTSVYYGRKKTKVLPGLGLPEKSALFELVKRTFPNLEPLKPLFDIGNWSSSRNIKPMLHAYSEGRTLKLEVWSYADLGSKVKELLKSEDIVESTNESNVLRLHSEPITYIEIIERNAEDVIHALDRERYGDKADIAYKRKLENIFRRIDGRKRSEFILSLIEIDRPEVYGRNDPKETLRRAFSKAGRVSQFIHPEQSVANFNERLLNSIYDLLTDSGFLPNRIENMNFEGVFLSFGIMAEFYGDVYPVISKLEGYKLDLRMFGRKEWVSFPEALFLSSNITKSQLLKRYNQSDREKLISFFKETLLNLIEGTDENITLLVDHRVKYFWDIFTNPNINSDYIFEQIGIEQYKDRIDIVRVNPSIEIPQYRINPKGKVEPFMGSGIFKGSNGIYYSVSLKPDTMIRIGKTHTKYANPTKLLLQQGITELIPIGYSSEREQDEMIRKVYRMRRLILAYNFHTKYPYLLHLNNKLRKYVTFITSKGTWDEFDERVNHYEQLELDI